MDHGVKLETSYHQLFGFDKKKDRKDFNSAYNTACPYNISQPFLRRLAAKELADFDAAACQHANAAASTVLDSYQEDAKVARSVIPKNKKKKDTVFVFDHL